MESEMRMNNEVTILLVEDDPGHARLIEKNLRRAGISNKIILLTDGQKALDFILDNPDDESRGVIKNCLLLLDLNLPRVDGITVLKRIKGDEKNRHIPVIILTTTDSPGEIARCYEFGCNVYITKPVDYARFSEAIRNLGFFLSIVKMPSEE